MGLLRDHIFPYHSSLFILWVSPEQSDTLVVASLKLSFAEVKLRQGQSGRRVALVMKQSFTVESHTVVVVSKLSTKLCQITTDPIILYR